MKLYMRQLLVASAALAACLVPMLAMADTGVHLQVGDLSTPAAVKAFDQRLNEAAHQLCSQGNSPHDLQAMKICVEEAREEILLKLTPAQLQAYHAASRSPAPLASAH